MDLGQRLQRVRLVLLDVDGVLTDGRLLYGAEGDMGRWFHVRDGSAMRLSQSEGIAVGILSGREHDAVRHRAEELGLEEIHQGHPIKEPVWDEILARRGLADEDVAFMGDDFLDLPVLRRAGLAAAPADATAEVLAAAHWTASVPGGAGCVRELLEAILRAQDLWNVAVERRLRPEAG